MNMLALFDLKLTMIAVNSLPQPLLQPQLKYMMPILHDLHPPSIHPSVRGITASKHVSWFRVHIIHKYPLRTLRS